MHNTSNRSSRLSRPYLVHYGSKTMQQHLPFACPFQHSHRFGCAQKGMHGKLFNYLILKYFIILYDQHHGLTGGWTAILHVLDRIIEIYYQSPFRIQCKHEASSHWPLATVRSFTATFDTTYSKCNYMSYI